MTIRELKEALEGLMLTGTPPDTLAVIEMKDGTFEPVDQLVSLSIGNTERVALV